MNNYYKNGKHGTMDGIPIWRPKWYGELGNDAEYREATKPRTAFKSAYYEGGHRMTIDGIPYRAAAYVAGWAPWMKRAIGQGTENSKQARQTEGQFKILFPSYVASREEGQACCVGCKYPYSAKYNDIPGWCGCPRPVGNYTQADYDAAKIAAE